MAERVSAAQRVQMQSLAEREVMRFAHDHALWHKHVHNVELDAMQVLKCIEMDRAPRTIDFSCRRTGKTAVKELYLLKHLATHADQEEGIVAPREAQSLVNLGYHLEAIRRSQILDAWLDFRAGRKQMADTYYRFANRSICKAYGIMAQVDGGDLTVASLEEVDDMPRDRLYSRFLLMLGGTRRLGAAEAKKADPQIRITGVFKGADTLSEMIAGGQYGVLPTIDAYLGIEMGIINPSFIELMRVELSADEYIRQLLCRNVSSRNLIWESKIREALATGLSADLQLVEPVPGGQYRKRGPLAFGYDHSGHGESPEASKYAFTVWEQLGNWIVPLYARTWPPGTDESIVRRDLLGYWRYFRPDYAVGDAYGIGLLTTLNDELYADGLTHIDRRTIGDGQSTASTWPEWAFAPLRFEGMTKHSMAQALRSFFHAGQAAMPYIDDAESTLRDASLHDYRLLIRQLGNIRPLPTKVSYSSYKMADSKIGDDLFDASMAAVWGLLTRGLPAPPAAVLTRSRSRAELLGAEEKTLLSR